MKKLLLVTVIITFFTLIGQSQGIISTNSANAVSAPVTTTGTPDSIKMVEYTGFYTIANNAMVDKMTIIFREGDLYGKAGEYPEAKMIFKKEDEFEDSGFGAQMFFKRTDNKVSSIKILVQDMEIIAVKESSKK